jgi:hypothetical protein
MKSLFQIACLLFMCSCTAPRESSTKIEENPKSLEKATTTRNWELGGFKVQFAAGPLNLQGKPVCYSTYAVSRADSGAYKIITSLVHVDSFVGGGNLTPDDFIELFCSPSGNQLLIAEGMLNDAAPCTNYIHILAEGDELKVSYLDLPSWTPPSDNLDKRAPIWSEFPKINNFTDEKIEFSYSNKKIQELFLDKIPRREGLIFP